MTQEQKERLEYQISVMQAALEGKEIEVSDKYSTKEEWELIMCEPSWNWGTCAYRVKPEPPKPIYRPFESAEEVMEAIKEHGDWVIDTDGLYLKVISIADSCIGIASGTWELIEAFNDFIFADGTLFGKLIKE